MNNLVDQGNCLDPFRVQNLASKPNLPFSAAHLSRSASDKNSIAPCRQMNPASNSGAPALANNVTEKV